MNREASILAALAGGRLTLAELCAASGLNFLQASYALGRLQRRGLVRVTDRRDGHCTSGRVCELVPRAAPHTTGGQP